MRDHPISHPDWTPEVDEDGRCLFCYPAKQAPDDGLRVCAYEPCSAEFQVDPGTFKKRFCKQLCSKRNWASTPSGMASEEARAERKQQAKVPCVGCGVKVWPQKKHGLDREARDPRCPRCAGLHASAQRAAA